MDPDKGKRQMLRAIEADFAFTASQTGRDRPSEAVRQALARVPRESFLPREMKSRAYENTALPIGGGQTISQPFIVALMTDLLDPEADQTILEIGTGSGYQAAVLAELVRKVYSVEVRPELAQESRERLESLDYRNVEIRTGDGYAGWPEHAPYDGIIVTAAAPRIPETLAGQLKPGGRVVIPIGPPYMHQELLLATKTADGDLRSRPVLGVAFVPFIEPDS